MSKQSIKCLSRKRNNIYTNIIIMFLVGILLTFSACKNSNSSNLESESSETESQASKVVSEISLSESKIDLEVGNEKEINISFVPSDAEDIAVNWESSDTSIAEVDSQGKIKAISAGNCIITVKLVSNSDVKADVEVEVLDVTKDDETETQDDSQPESQSKSVSYNQTSTESHNNKSSEAYYGDWKTVIVNSERAVPSNWSVNTTSVAGSTVDERIAPALRKLLDAAHADGVSTSICSGYRSIETQQRLVDNSVYSFRNQGYSYDEALRLTYKEIAVPGHSEHNLGLAVDFYSSETGLTGGFEGTSLGKWLLKNAHKYGFILRYPKDKVSVTGIIYEPWHYRYVGVENAASIKNSGLCMEEYFR